MTDLALDWAVAKSQGAGAAYVNTKSKGCVLLLSDDTPHCAAGEVYSPSTDFGQAYPIIYENFIATFSVETRPFEGQWAADISRHQQVDTDEMGQPMYSFYLSSLSYGPTPLVAAMRCIVARELGLVVDVPDELVPDRVERPKMR